MQGFLKKVDALLNPYLKTAPKHFFQGSTPWVTQILKNVIVWIVLYYAHKLLRWKKKHNPLPTFFE